MSITAKELAAQLGISAAAVSMALNDKPGVSTQTRKRIKAAAEKAGYDFTRIRQREIADGSIYFIIYKKSGAVVSETPFFSELSEGVSTACKERGQKLKITYLYEDDLQQYPQTVLENLTFSDCIGFILLGTEMEASDITVFEKLSLPMVLLDSYVDTIHCDAVLINNIQGAYLATTHLIKKCKCQPGYLKSVYPINNFRERSDGFYRAIRANGMSTSQSIVHTLSPSYEGAYADMKDLLERGESLAKCYFADNDLIAAGAMKAMKEAGFQIPADVAVIGFDNLPVSQIILPNLTTVNVPKQYMGTIAVERLLQRIKKPAIPVVKTEIAVSLVDRYSC
jgi:LacI family transcriptional regulator